MQGFRIGVRLSTEGSSGEVVDDWEVILGVRSGALLKLLVREQICMQLLVGTTQGLGSFTIHSQLETKMAASRLLGLLGLFLPRVGLKELPLAFKSYSGCYHFSEARPPPELFTLEVRSAARIIYFALKSNATPVIASLECRMDAQRSDADMHPNRDRTSGPLPTPQATAAAELHGCLGHCDNVNGGFFE